MIQGGGGILMWTASLQDREKENEKHEHYGEESTANDNEYMQQVKQIKRASSSTEIKWQHIN
jgi:hypothetical protein